MAQIPESALGDAPSIILARRQSKWRRHLASGMEVAPQGAAAVFRPQVPHADRRSNDVPRDRRSGNEEANKKEEVA
jgi:hypothetical protein